MKLCFLLGKQEVASVRKRAGIHPGTPRPLPVEGLAKCSLGVCSEDSERASGPQPALSCRTGSGQFAASGAQTPRPEEGAWGTRSRVFRLSPESTPVLGDAGGIALNGCTVSRCPS